jgi:hypothetical protein
VSYDAVQKIYNHKVHKTGKIPVVTVTGFEKQQKTDANRITASQH